MVSEKSGLRHAGNQESGYVYDDEIDLEYVYGETACGTPYAWHSGRAWARLHFVDPDDRYPTCLWCAACP